MANTADKPFNGNYGSHQPYSQAETYHSSQGQVPAPANGLTGSFGDQPSATQSATAPAAADEKVIPKEEIGWFFVEQYYNTMSKEPSKLFLYYTRRSQFVSGNEAEKVPVAVGQRSISERIKELDIQDCKVRVSNVDTQESFKNILVQVIGEMSNKAAPHRKFVQTFVLAEQPTGYYVLNDIFRYIIDEEEENENGGSLQEEPAPSQAPEPASTTLARSDEPAEQEQEAEQVDRKLEEEIQKPADVEPTVLEPASTNGFTDSGATEINDAEDAVAAAPVSNSTETTKAVEEAEEAVAIETETQPEKPQDPDPTPVASPPKSTQATPAQNQPAAAPPKPAAPKTWANLVKGSGASAPPVTNGAKSASPATPAPPKPKPASSVKESTTPTTPNADETTKPQQNGNGGWQMAGSDSNKRQGRQHSQSVSSNQENVLGYVKNVTEKVDASILKATLSDFGKLVYFDVSRQKNCAFVEFADPAAYNAAVAANPHNIGGEQIFVEERRPRANAYGGNFGGRGGGMRGGRGPNDGRPGSQNRGPFPKDGNRGGYGPRAGRGGPMASRPRTGQTQAAS